jgi:hypothetical protein
MTDEDYLVFTGGKETDIGLHDFEVFMRQGLKFYAQRQMANAMEIDSESDIAPIMIVLKVCMYICMYV